ncbi:MAG TPA: copper resistance protein CopC [Gaiellaceae bacterium]|nr:copper resistance protein CopC [Gaiellaceae bacterium]
MNRRLALTLTGVAALAAPAAGWAHANVVQTVPATGSVLAHGPAAVRVLFDDSVRVGPGVEAIRNGGASIIAGRAHVEGRTLVIPLRHGLPNGDYSVRWSIISNDGHLESGVIAFAVGLGRAPPLTGLAPEATGPTVDSVVARWLFLVGVLGAAGIALFALVAKSEDQRIPVILATGCALAGLGAGDEVRRVGLATRDGTALGAGVVLALVVALLAGAATLERRALRPALVLALGLVAVPAFAGHALDPGLNRVNVVADVLHVLGASAWVGALLGAVLFRRIEPRLAVGGVALLGVTGILRASFELTSASQVWDISYGRLLLVKTGVLLAALALALRRRRVLELALVAGLVVAVAVLVQLRPGRNIVSVRAPVQSSEPAPAPPPTANDAIVLAREAGPLGVVIAAEPRRMTAIVLSPSGGGLNGLDVRVDGHATKRCGSGCYAADYRHARGVSVDVTGYGAPQRAAFVLPAHAPGADQLVRHALATFKALQSVSYREHLASDPVHSITAFWRLEKPARVAYTLSGGGAAGIVIGDRRWDRIAADKPWQESPQTPLPQPATQWTYATSAHVIAETSRTTTVSFADPTIPAYFTVTLDKRTLLPSVLHMVAPAHFMVDRYLSFNAPRAIRPPR